MPAAIFQRSSRLVIGRGLDDANQDGFDVNVAAGDVVVVPAGVSHRSLSSEGDDRYIGVYPIVSPQFSSNFISITNACLRQHQSGETTFAKARSRWKSFLKKLSE